MGRGNKLLIVAIVLSVGFGTALLFRRPSEPPAPSLPGAAAGPGLQLREPGAIHLGPPREGVAPLVPEPKGEPTPQPVPTAVAAPLRPAALVPPELPGNYLRDAQAGSRPLRHDSAMLDDALHTALPIEPTHPVARQRTHRVVDGDTLSRLALRYLGSADRFVEIYEANRDVLPEPDVLPIGVQLKIPPETPSSTLSQAAPAAPTMPVRPLVPVSPEM